MLERKCNANFLILSHPVLGVNMRISPSDQRLNAGLAAEWGPRLTAADRKAIANHFGVSLRTAQRWFPAGGPGLAQQLPFVTASRPERRQFAETLLFGYTQPSENTDERKVYRDVSAKTIIDAVDTVQAIPEGRYTDFMKRWAREVRIVRSGGKWVVEIWYEPYPLRRRGR